MAAMEEVLQVLVLVGHGDLSSSFICRSLGASFVVELRFMTESIS